MPYIVLARKYRPQNFDDLIGQEHITEILKKSIQSNRLAHAFLFCGPRGVGKTSCARILAKSLNCQNGPTVNACDQCPACLEITKSTSFDVIEIDGASNRGIDEIRTLRENVKFAPSYGHFKIYIIDEVHMLTTEAFNALLKTLEEPPAHVKFILATTAPSKVPTTIISRCQRFDFRRISVPSMEKALSNICKLEKFKVDADALFAIAKAASGSLRDALSILDQLSALSARDIKATDVYSMLGLVEIELLFELTDSLAQRNCAKALETLDKIINHGKDIKQLTKDLIEHFRHLMIVKIGGKTLGPLIDYPVATKERLFSQSQGFSLPEILKGIDIFIEAQDMSQAMDFIKIPLEIAFAKLTLNAQNDLLKNSASQPPGKNVIDLCTTNDKESRETKVSLLAAGKIVDFHKDIDSEKANKPESKNPAKKSDTPWSAMMDTLADQKGQVDFSRAHSADDDQALEPNPQIEATTLDIPLELNLNLIMKSWDSITHAISREKMSVATFLQEGSPYMLKDNKLTISFPEDAAFHKESLEEKANCQLIERIFSQKFGTKILIDFKIVDDHKPQENEPLIKSALDTFKGKVVNKWHRE